MEQPEMSPEDLGELSMIATIARRYYHDKATQKQIASELHLTQTDVSRYLKLAEQKQIVRFDIDPYFSTNLSAQLQARFPHLKDALIIPRMEVADNGDEERFLERLGMACTQYFLSVVHHAATIGVSCGETVEAFIDALGRRRSQGMPVPIACQVYPLLILMMPEVVSVTPASLVANCVRMLPDARGKAFQLPAVSTPQEVSVYRDHPQIQTLLSDIETLDYYVLGIGSIDYVGRMRRLGKLQHMTTHDFNALVVLFHKYA